MRTINAENCEGCELYEYNLDLEEENENLAEKNRELVQIIKEEREAKHGEWETGLLREFRDTNIEAQEKADKAGYVRYVVNLKCSACGKITMVDNSIKYNFCPNCGAKMDGGKKCD